MVRFRVRVSVTVTVTVSGNCSVMVRGKDSVRLKVLLRR